VSQQAGTSRGRRGPTLAAAAVLGLLLMVDVVVLRGEQVARASVPLSGGEPAVLELERVGEPHLFEIETHRRVRGRVRGRSVKLLLEDPNGVDVYEESELVAHKERFFSYTPSIAGSYRLHVEDNGHLLDARSHRARVDVRVNDHRFLSRALAWLSF